MGKETLRKTLVEYCFEEGATGEDKFDYICPLINVYKIRYGVDEWIDDFVYKYSLIRRHRRLSEKEIS